MKLTAVIVSCLALAAITSCNNSNTPATATADSTGASKDSIIRKVVILDAEANSIIDSTAAVEVLADGFKWAEGPLYIKDSNYLLFSDIPNNSIFKWQEGKGATLYLKPSGHTGTNKVDKEPGSNGLMLNAKGQLVLCQHGDRRIALMDAPVSNPAAKFTTLAGAYNGKKLNSPNDGVFAANGDLYFTDPPYGLDGRLQDTGKQLDFQGVYRLTPAGKLDLLTKDIKFPNGIALSGDNKTLYVANSDSTHMTWHKFDLDDKGMIKTGTLFYEAKDYNNTDAGNPDGMKISRQGYLFCAGPQGIWIFTPGGKLIARIYTGQKAANCAFSPGEKTLFITSSAYLLRVKLK